MPSFANFAVEGIHRRAFPIVMARLVRAIQASQCRDDSRRGCPAQRRAQARRPWTAMAGH